MEYLAFTNIAQSIKELAGQVFAHNGPCCVYSCVNVDNHRTITDAQVALIGALGSQGSVIITETSHENCWGFRVTPLTDLSPVTFTDPGAYI